ncbi:type III secretion system chaperone [Pleionea sp. CnH1-48]|uniref:type III secretion system chaperone n=1 Tax=Pleionea sp. CnH1-48 TaxID=2954494 RepID=UPI00209704AA|nr:type III secretion system chaperone [Pleionea sp. CnH1-48]MCO7223272.1 type III secretion system chaperone [Pleionea sp. CnH1-48]
MHRSSISNTIKIVSEILQITEAKSYPNGWEMIIEGNDSAIITLNEKSEVLEVSVSLTLNETVPINEYYETLLRFNALGHETGGLKFFIEGGEEPDLILSFPISVSCFVPDQVASLIENLFKVKRQWETLLNATNTSQDAASTFGMMV